MHHQGMKAIVKKSIIIGIKANTTKSLKIDVKNVMTRDTKLKIQIIVLENEDAQKKLIDMLTKKGDIVDGVSMLMKMIVVLTESVEINRIEAKKAIDHQAEMMKIDMKDVIGKYNENSKKNETMSSNVLNPKCADMVKDDRIEMANIVMKLMDRITKRTIPDMNVVAEDEVIEIATENVKIITDITTIDITDQRNMNVIAEMIEVKPISTNCFLHNSNEIFSLI